MEPVHSHRADGVVSFSVATLVSSVRTFRFQFTPHNRIASPVSANKGLVVFRKKGKIPLPQHCAYGATNWGDVYIAHTQRCVHLIRVGGTQLGVRVRDRLCYSALFH